MATETINMMTGIVRKVTYSAPEKNFAIVQLVMSDGAQISAKGRLVDAKVGDELEFEGQFVSHPVYGKNIQVRGTPKVLRSGADLGDQADDSEIATLDAVIDTITYRNADTGYTVLRITDRVHGEGITLTGVFPLANVGLPVTGSALWSHDPRYGKQLKATKKTVVAEPVTSDGIKRYLESGAIPGIGKVTAARLVDAFGTDTLRILREDPKRVASIKGISKNKAQAIKGAAHTNQEAEAVVTWLMSHGLPTGVSFKIFRKYEADSIRVLNENPWVLCEVVDGIGFTTADEVAAKMGRTGLIPNRIRAALLHVLSERGSEGHTGGYVEDIRKEMLECLREPPSDQFNEVFDAVLRQALTGGEISSATRQGEAGFLQGRWIGEDERSSAIRILGLADNPTPWSHEAAIAAIPKVEEKTGIKLSKDQAVAVRSAVSSGFTLLVGGPGRGKTTVTGVILGAILKANPSVKIVLASPTGKAATRLAEATGMPSMTIHRLLEWGGNGRPMRNSERPLVGDLFVFDEVSMMDSRMLSNIMEALPENAAVLFIGDRDQLPSVGAGNVLADLLRSKRVTIAELTEVHRQAAGSCIIQAADAVNRGDKAGIRRGHDLDIVVPLPPEDMNPEDWSPTPVLRDEALRWVTEVLPAKGFSQDDIQVITAGRKALSGTEELNMVLRKALNPEEGPELQYGQMGYRAGDRILVTKNNYDLRIFNGMTGVVRLVDKENSKMLCEIDGAPVTLMKADLKDISLGYALTCHKMQGSQARCVVLIVDTAHYMLLERNWLYTAITRAAKHLVILSAPKAVGIAVRTVRARSRQTMLLDYLTLR